MVRGPLYDEDYKPTLSGHETFPLRYGWLKKAFDAIAQSPTNGENKSLFTGDDAIARFGVGKNMVASMRHWAKCVGITDDEVGKQRIEVTPLGELLFGLDGIDPYMESPSSLWLIHWHLSGRAHKTTWFWAFNHFPALSFERDTLVKSIKSLADQRNWHRTSESTIRRDVSCFLRTYAALLTAGPSNYEDALESPLIELGLIKSDGTRDGFRFVRGPKPSLDPSVFCYAVSDYWAGTSSAANTLSFEALIHEPGSPGRVFMLDENSLVELLDELDLLTDGIYRWSETAGLKQLIRTRDMTEEDSLAILAARHRPSETKDAA